MDNLAKARAKPFRSIGSGWIREGYGDEIIPASAITYGPRHRSGLHHQGAVDPGLCQAPGKFRLQRVDNGLVRRFRRRYDVQSANRATLPPGHDERLLQRPPAGVGAVHGNHDIRKEARIPASGDARGAPVAGRWTRLQLVGSEGLPQPLAEPGQGPAAGLAAGSSQIFRSRVGGNIPTQRFLQFGPVLGKPEIEVGFCPVGEVLQQPLLANNLDHRPVDGIVPVDDRLFIRYLPLLLQTHIVAMDAYVFLQFPVGAGGRHGQVRFRAFCMQTGAFQEAGVARLDDNLVRIHVRGDGDGGAYLGDEGRNGVNSHLAGHRNPVVAVEHEVNLAQLVNLDGRPPAHAGGHRLDPGPSLLHTVAPGQKGAGEIGVTAHTAHNLVEWDLLQTALHAPVRANLTSDLFVRE